MRFTVAIKKEGAPEETRSIEAESRFSIYEMIRKEGGQVVSITEASNGTAWLKRFNISFGSGVKGVQLVVMTKNLSAILNAGLSLSRALSIIERQSPGKRLRLIAKELGESISKGLSFHEALAEHPKVFSPLYVAMVRAGEESGSLVQSLAVVGLQMERSQALIRKIRGAMIYPAVVITAVIIVGVLMLIYVVPTLTQTFKELKVELPLATKIVVAISDFMAGNVILVFGMLIALFFGIFFGLRTKQGRNILLLVALRIPVIGNLVKETYAVRASRTLSSLLTAGVPVLNGLSITEEVVGARIFADVIAEAEARVKKGEPISTAFADHPKLYPLLLAEMLAVGEETGQMAEMLKQIAEFYENDVEQQTKDLSTIIEPILMLVIGGMVGVFALAMIAPIYSLSSAI